MKRDGNNLISADRRAFTLVELLAVIGIIVILASLLMPSLIAARNIAKEATCCSLIHTLSSGLDMYKTEVRLGHTYPPSFWDERTGGCPYDTSGISQNVAFGAQTLVWGLAGADTLGTPGFSDPGANLLNQVAGGLYRLDDANGQPLVARYGPFIDVNKTAIKKVLVGSAQNGALGDPCAPVILDSFNRAILYFRADQTKTALDKYSIYDNWGFRTNWGVRKDTDTDPLFDTTTWGKFITDQRAHNLNPKVIEPVNSDSYILLSAGVDGRFGTSDDIYNFLPQ